MSSAAAWPVPTDRQSLWVSRPTTTTTTTTTSSTPRRRKGPRNLLRSSRVVNFLQGSSSCTGSSERCVRLQAAPVSAVCTSLVVVCRAVSAHRQCPPACNWKANLFNNHTNSHVTSSVGQAHRQEEISATGAYRHSACPQERAPSVDEISSQRGPRRGTGRRVDGGVGRWRLGGRRVTQKGVFGRLLRYLTRIPQTRVH